MTSDYKLNAEWKLGQADLDLINTGNMPLLADIAVTRYRHFPATFWDPAWSASLLGVCSYGAQWHVAGSATAAEHEL